MNYITYQNGALAVVGNVSDELGLLDLEVILEAYSQGVKSDELMACDVGNVHVTISVLEDGTWATTVGLSESLYPSMEEMARELKSLVYQKAKQ